MRSFRPAFAALWFLAIASAEAADKPPLEAKRILFLGDSITHSGQYVDQFSAYVAARRATLRRTAYLLCGDWHTAEDLVQIALVKLYVAWPRIHTDGAEDAYARRIISKRSSVAGARCRNAGS